MSDEARTGRRGTRSRIAMIGFPIVLWFIATFFLLGDLGRINDDWYYIQRVPETGAVRSLVQDRPIHFWRPLYRVVVPSLLTLLWHHGWISHLILAVVHGLNAWLLWRLMGALGVRQLGAAVTSLAFMAAPWHFEVVFWQCNVPTGLSTGVMLGTMLATVGWARSGAGWWLVPMAAAATFVSASLNEQPTLMVGALPLVALCAIRGPGAKRAFWRATAASAAGAVTMVLYTLLHLKVVGPKFNVGGAHGVLPLDGWLASAKDAIVWVAQFMGSADWTNRSFQCAEATFREFPLRTAAAGIAALACGAAWVAHSARHGHERSPRAGDYTARPVFLALLGVAIFVLGALPVVAFRYWLMPRMMYAPAIGVAIAFGAAFAALAEWSRLPLEKLVRSRAVLAALAAVALVVQAVMMVGVQEAYRRRYRSDQAALAELVAQAPDPEAQSIFVPAFTTFPDMPAAAARFEGYYWSVFCSWWSSEWAIQLTYRRSDIRAQSANWGQSGWIEPTANSVRVPGFGRIPWSRVVPFILDGQGHVRLITSVRFDEGGEAREIALPQPARFVSAGAAVPNTYTFPAARP